MFMEGSKILMRGALYLYLLKEPELKKKKNVLEIKELFENLSKDKDVLSCHTFIEVFFNYLASYRKLIFLSLNRI